MTCPHASVLLVDTNWTVVASFGKHASDGVEPIAQGTRLEWSLVAAGGKVVNRRRGTIELSDGQHLAAVERVIARLLEEGVAPRTIRDVVHDAFGLAKADAYERVLRAVADR